MPTSADTPEVRARLEELTAAGGGRLTPERVVEDARSNDSPLHAHFEWDDGAAAAAYRIEQARTLIRSVRFEFEVREVKLSTVAYVRDPGATSGEQGYAPVVRVRSEQETARAALEAELERVRTVVARARALALACGQVAEVEAGLAEIFGVPATKRRQRSAVTEERPVV